MPNEPLSDAECTRVADLIRAELLSRLVSRGYVTPSRAAMLEARPMLATVREALRFTDRVEVPFPGSGETITFTHEGVF